MKLAHKIINRLRREAHYAVAYAISKVFDTQPSQDELLVAWHRLPDPANGDGCIKEWLQGPNFQVVLEKPSREESAEICGKADQVLSGTTSLFGHPSSVKILDLWHNDPLTGKEWQDKIHFTRFKIQHRSLDGITDIRRLWELGRFGWALPLARAFAVTRNPAYARTWSVIVENFIKENPPEFGPHWLNAMEVAIRAIQWCRGYSLLRISNADLQVPPSLLPSLLAHGRYIREHLEWTPFGRTNHYIADLVGLLTLSVFVPQFREAKDWKYFAVEKLEREIKVQTNADGFHDEASTAYHHFALELYALAVKLDQVFRLGFSSEFHGRVRSMAKTDQFIRGPEGIDPRIGDDDSGTLDLGDLGFLLEESIPTPPPSSLGSRELKASGIYILRHGKLSCHVACGSNGQQGVGGHAHNDKLSLVVRFEGREIVVDSGTYCYSSHPYLRDRFRSTAMHNTMIVDSMEQSPLKDWRKLQDHAHAHCLDWSDKEDQTLFVGEHDGYRSRGVVHRRSVQLDKQHSRLVVLDEMEAKGSHCYDFYLHLSPRLERKNLRVEKGRVSLPGCEFIFPEETHIEILNTQYSPIYGMQIPNLTLHLRATVLGSWRLPWEFHPF